MKEKTAIKIVEAIIEDLADRSGIGDEWSSIDDDIKEEIKRMWIDILLLKS